MTRRMGRDYSPLRSFAHHARALGLQLVLPVGGLLGAFAPFRFWPAVDVWVPVSSWAMTSGAVTTIGGAIVAFTGVLENLRTPPLTYLLTTPQGLGGVYLMLSGTMRMASCVAGEPLGDPVLSLADWMWRHHRQGRHDAAEIARRHALEGPQVRDRVLEGSAAGYPEADFIIIASQRKDGWRTGTIVCTANEAWYRVLRIDEAMIAGRLRTVYLLVRHGDLEVARHVVRYEGVVERK